MNFPVDDVVKNIRQFMISVKKATGNMRDDSGLKAAKGAGPKPGTSLRQLFNCYPLPTELASYSDQEGHPELETRP